ncbi:ATP-dependent helicase/nuclease subunit A [Alkalibacillus filiformis]|uniref:ATP-dependent helicase/nuclease subunit A n=1 Tax=Alkalibacillus filiformis TaxID=200990 RepID=A0ABU0DTE4_9BACI|nr:helicase-exonuclease AddAB subunit AddA [Alkalibacillus filiformis]MDQ0351727.1 ATP-dependent helicase/nuclease subunit A [Alkalibacillus filiformis]
MKWTDEQASAIYEAGKDILVSAAAGSGKTAVLVERIIQKMLDEHDPFNIDEMLVATFTNAAAQEMKNRVGQALEKALEDNPESHHLKKQIALLQRANISTLHSFCMNVVRKYSYQLDLDPSFRILDQVESEMLKKDVIQEVFEEWYGKEGYEQEKFFRFVDSFSNDRNDEQVEELVLKVHEFALQNPKPFEWLDALVAMYDVDEEAPLDELRWMPYAKADIKEVLEAAMFDVNQALDVAQDVDGPAHYVEALEQDKEQIQLVIAAVGGPWSNMRDQVLANKKFATLSRKKYECDPELQKQVKSIRERYKKKFTDMAERWFNRDPASFVKDLRKLVPHVEQLVAVVKEFHSKLEAEKREQGALEFADLEHYSLDVLLAEEATMDDLKPSDVAKQYQNQFREVLIDEYQDTNLVQETILQLLTGDEQAGHLFMVGDVKQSIYGFRHAEPSLFMTKYKQFQDEAEPSMRIDLAQNFRSRHEVLASTNYIFRQLLDEQVGEMEYEKDAELIYSNQIYETLTDSDVDTELHILSREEEEEPDESDEWKYLEKAQIEARAYAKKIQSWVGTDDNEPMYIIDKETERPRPVRYSDIVILMRSKTWFGTVVEELKQLGIPIYADLSAGYLEAIEVQVMLNVLKTIDNPKQDIPLASVLKSPIVGLNEDELAQIRLHGRKESFDVAVKNYMKSGENADLMRRLERFFSMFEQWRKQAKYGALSDLIWQIYRETGYYEFVGGTPGGKQRQANLRALYDRARSYERSSYRGLFRFLRFIEKMEERGDDLAAARALGEQEDVVRLMSIHTSKGLEFPLVILGAADKDFNTQDYKKRYLLHKDLGFGAKYMDVDNRIMYKTFPFEAMTVAMKREMLAEEMRVLYVALTRAKEKLVVMGTVNDYSKRVQKWLEVGAHQYWVLPAHMRSDQANYMNWIGMSLVRHEMADALHEGAVPAQVPESIRRDDSKWNVVVDHAREYENPEFITVQRNDTLERAIKEWDVSQIQDKTEQFDEVDHRLTYRYEYPSSQSHRAKQTVTELKRIRQEEDEYSATDFLRKQMKSSLKRPRFMQQDVKTLTKAEIGSAMHAVMQHLPFDRDWDQASLEEFVSGLVFKEILTDEEAEVIDYDAILHLFDTKAGQLLNVAEDVRRELPFTMELKVKEVYPDWQDDTNESVLIQGVIDCLMNVEGKWYLVDYKTDTIVGDVNDKQVDRLANRYEVQVDLYRRAVESIWGVELSGVYLYFFDRALVIEM